MVRFGAVAALILLVLAQAVPLAAPRHAAAATAPNIVVVMVDDMPARMVEDLPGMQELFTDQGLSFTSFYAAAPQCCPSRASFLRGQYPHNTGVLKNGPPQGGYGAFRNNGLEGSTVATWLQDAGYRTGLIGKYLNGYEKFSKRVPTGWNRWFVYAGEGKYTTWDVSDQGKLRTYGKKKQNKHYQTDVLADKAVGFINTAPDDSPLFLFFSPSAPHEPATPAPRHKKAAVARDGAPRPPSFNEEDMGDKSSAWRGRGTLPGKRLRDIDRLYVKQLKTMLSVEGAVERIVAALEAESRLANTYLVFTADNGVHHGEHRIASGKQTPFEESILAPLIVVGPGVPSGATIDAMASNIDLGPTFAEIAGTTAPAFVDGRSLVPLLDGNPPGSWREAVVAEFPVGPGGGFVVLRSGPHSYTAYENGEHELYDLGSDPYQIDNVFDSAPQPLRDDLQAQLDALATCGETGPTTCQEADGGA